MSDFDNIAAQLPDPFRLLWREKVSSTNDELRALAEKGMAEGLVLVAEEQVAGRGRRGAEWFSPKGESLAFSVLLRPTEPKGFWSRLSLVAGLAVAEALEKYVPLEVVKRLGRYAPEIGSGFLDLLTGIRERCHLTGRHVALTCADRRREGLVRGIGSAGELLLDSDGKTEAIVQADEVRLITNTGC